MSNDLSGIDMAELRKMLTDPMTRAHAFKELDRRIVKRLHEILENADGTSEPLETFHPNLVKQLSAEFEMDFAECEGFGDMILWEYERLKKLSFQIYFNLRTKLCQWVKSAHFWVSNRADTCAVHQIVRLIGKFLSRPNSVRT